jgi:dihydroxyacetone kinase
MSDVIDGNSVIAAMERVIERILNMRNELNQLDAAMGDGDTGITASKGANGLREFLATNPPTDDLGLFFFNAGKAINQAASSTLGTLTATALMKAGKEAKGRSSIDLNILVKMLGAASVGVQERGKAKLGDKTVVDSLKPAAEAFEKAVEDGQNSENAAMAMLKAARNGRDNAKKLRSKIGRAAWVGERTENQLDPGTVLFVSILEAILDIRPGEKSN